MYIDLLNENFRPKALKNALFCFKFILLQIYLLELFLKVSICEDGSNSNKKVVFIVGTNFCLCELVLS